MKLNKYVYLGNCRISDDEKCTAGWSISMHFIAYTKDSIPLSTAYNTAGTALGIKKKNVLDIPLLILYYRLLNLAVQCANFIYHWT